MPSVITFSGLSPEGLTTTSHKAHALQSWDVDRVCQGKRKFSLMLTRKNMNVSKVMLNQKDYQWLKFLGITLKPSQFSCLAPIARYSWSCPLLFPELLHSNIRGEYETLRNAKYLVPIDGTRLLQSLALPRFFGAFCSQQG